VLVNKGADSVIAEPGGECAVSVKSNSWLSTAGTGDVLAGIAAARRAVETDPFAAAKRAVWLHNRAAMSAGPAFTPEDLIANLPAALAECL
jgi:NAD(P)H-hydrate repair Nnr-like enzyme with NAD(P)H-hydrate dehydratase domain